MKLIILFILVFFISRTIVSLLSSKKIDKNSKKNIIDAEFEEIE